MTLELRNDKFHGIQAILSRVCHLIKIFTFVMPAARKQHAGQGCTAVCAMRSTGRLSALFSAVSNHINHTINCRELARQECVPPMPGIASHCAPIARHCEAHCEGHCEPLGGHGKTYGHWSCKHGPAAHLPTLSPLIACPLLLIPFAGHFIAL